MKILTTTIVAALFGAAVTPSFAQNSFRAEFDALSPQEQAAVRAEAIQKEGYDQLPVAPLELNHQTVTGFCMLLPRGLETLIPQKFAARGETGQQLERTKLWARYISCQDSLLYYEGHRFFNSGHYTEDQISSAIYEIGKVMKWLERQEEELDSGRKYSKAY
ncbi:MAG: hypothetical protein P1V20_22510 [Verrucomicrobiales bacterium]|nr:hypothetical protein [Verrucomicrobiales bacterium]